MQPQTWEWALLCARDLQDDAGAFHYQSKSPWTCGMTAAGIASMLICKEQIALRGEVPPAWIDERVASGLRFLGERLDFSKNVHGEGERMTAYHYYHLYSIERVGALSGKHEIGGKAWYPRGAKYLVDEQIADGSWVDRTCMNPEDVLGTCFALLFLKKATMPSVTISGD